jgi:hypothetical protein
MMHHRDWCAGAYWIQYLNRNGDFIKGMGRWRVFPRPEISKKDLITEKWPKYVTPTREMGASGNFDVTMPYLRAPRSGKDVLLICEGEKKTVKAADRFKEAAVIGIGGCWMWTDGGQSTDRGLHPDILWALDHTGCKEVVIVADPDVKTKKHIAQGYNGLRKRIEEEGVKAKVVELGEKLDQFLVNNPEFILDELLKIPSVEDLELQYTVADLVAEYRLVAKETRAGFVIVNDHTNAVKLLNGLGQWAGKIRYNEDKQQIEIDGENYMEGHHDDLILRVIHERLCMPQLSMGMLKDAIIGVAYEHKYSPIREEIMAEEWDGKKRCWRLFKNVNGDKLDPYTQKVAKAVVKTYVERQLNPGCHMRFMVFLLGPQGIGKTGFVDWLAGEGNVVDLRKGDFRKGDKDALIALATSTVRIDDVDSLSDMERGQLKSLVTSRSFRIRFPYNKTMETVYRRGIMIATSNELSVLPDDTENTRYLVVELGKGKIDFQWLNANRLQIFAEARQMDMPVFNFNDPNDAGRWRNHVEEAEYEEELDDYIALIEDGKRPRLPDLINANGVRHFRAKDFFMWLDVEKRGGFHHARNAHENRKFKDVALRHGCKHFNDYINIRGKKYKKIYRVGG